jgi:hypothetical protein
VSGVIGFIPVSSNRTGFLMRIRIIGLITFVLNAPNPEFRGIEKLFWGMGASIFRSGYEYFSPGGLVFLYSAKTHSGRRFQPKLSPFCSRPNLYSKVTKYLRIPRLFLEDTSLERTRELAIDRILPQHCCTVDSSPNPGHTQNF